jgi:hypothetical protein
MAKFFVFLTQNSPVGKKKPVSQTPVAAFGLNQPSVSSAAGSSPISSSVGSSAGTSSGSAAGFAGVLAGAGLAVFAAAAGLSAAGFAAAFPTAGFLAAVAGVADFFAAAFTEQALPFQLQSAFFPHSALAFTFEHCSPLAKAVPPKLNPVKDTATTKQRISDATICKTPI